MQATPTIQPTHALAYIRCSPNAVNLGPMAQYDAIQAYATSHAITLLAVYRDLSVSGATPLSNRPALLQLLSDLRSSPKGTSLLVAKRDRLARDVLTAHTIEKALPRHSLILAADGLGNGTSAADTFLKQMLDGVAQLERSMIASRTSAALQVKRRNNLSTGNAPYGKCLSSDGRTLQDEPTEQAIISLCRTLLAGGHSQNGIVRHLAGLGVRSRAGRPLALQQVRRILGLDSSRARPIAA